MGGLIFFGILGGWIFLSFYLPVKIPGWLGMQRYGGLVTIVLIPLMLGAMFIDEVIGMRQFEKLCKERAVVWVSPEAGQVIRAASPDLPIAELKGYWIAIQSQPVAYLDVDTGNPFFKYEILHTKGGRVASIALMGGEHSCVPKNQNAVTKKLNIDALLKNGKSL